MSSSIDNSSPSFRYRVRRSLESDAQGICDVMNHREVFPQMLQTPFSAASMWSERLKSGQAENVLHLVALLEEQVVGAASIYGPVLVRRQHVRGLGMAVHPQHWGQGVSRLLMDALLDSADNWLSVSRIELTVFTDNARAIALYKAYGFEIEGTFKQYAVRDGALVDAYSMARLKN